MPQQTAPTEFRGKTWIYVHQRLSSAALPVGGPRMQRKLAIFALFFRLGGDREQRELVGDQLVFDESVFVAPLDEIAQSFLDYSADAAARQRLPSWDD